MQRVCWLVCLWVCGALALGGCKGKDAPSSASSSSGGGGASGSSGGAEGAGPAVYGPRLVADKMPPGLGGVLLGKATEADLVALLGAPSERDADTEMGGTMSVRYNDQPAIKLTWSSEAAVRRRAKAQQLSDDETEAAVRRLLQRLPTEGPLARYESISVTLTRATPAEPPTLLTLWARANDQGQPQGLCAWLDQAVGQDPEALRCPGTNRRLKRSDSHATLCAGDAEGARNVLIECNPGEGANVGTASLEMTLSR